MVDRRDRFYYKGYDIHVTKEYGTMYISISNSGGMHITEISLYGRKYKDILLNMKFALDNGIAHFEANPLILR